MLNVSVEGTQGYLHFRCRIGHAFSTDELITAKERQFEDHLWSALTTLAELMQLLRDLRNQGVQPERHPPFAERIRRGEIQDQDVRRVLEETRAIDLHSDPGAEPATRASGDAVE